MLKRILVAILAVLMLFAVVGCGDNVVYDDLSGYESINPALLDKNPLTGLAVANGKEIANRRPIAVMIENSSESVHVQTNVCRADVIYETETEGGITRLMAVYQDISALEKLGNVRSARYDFIDLAMGHNAIYVHCGQDPHYAKPHLKDLDDLSIDTNSQGAVRIQNGLASWHTLYAIGNELWENIKGKFETTQTNVTPWQNFTEEKLSLDGGSAKDVSIPFPTTTTKFAYDDSTGLYTRMVGDKEHTDYFTEEKTYVKNIFVLLTDMGYFPKEGRRDIDLVAGEGYYITNGTMQKIKWSKGDAQNAVKFTDEAGAEIKVSAGNSWVCIANKETCKPVIQ
ncbi:MAG: DUF3048 domain-containing protein [Clostridia bacterium]|nr:DUF3048 domain-containing protein [Clostridia bacterium]